MKKKSTKTLLKVMSRYFFRKSNKNQKNYFFDSIHGLSLSLNPS